jgi:hypothetical protein
LGAARDPPDIARNKNDFVNVRMAPSLGPFSDWKQGQTAQYELYVSKLGIAERPGNAQYLLQWKIRLNHESEKKA